MTVFDKSSFGTRLKEQRFTTAKSEWTRGFNGYEAALARYIELNKK